MAADTSPFILCLSSGVYFDLSEVPVEVVVTLLEDWVVFLVLMVTVVVVTSFAGFCVDQVCVGKFVLVVTVVDATFVRFAVDEVCDDSVEIDPVDDSVFIAVDDSVFIVVGVSVVVCDTVVFGDVVAAVDVFVGVVELFMESVDADDELVAVVERPQHTTHNKINNLILISMIINVSTAFSCSCLF